ncbi:MAG: hypothetical protein LBT85_02860 [Bifidobacteriaceae bacterium]|jgi:hypothetical protein|nr:hypothetical protein [Bifidobacteriaceae bacterium]
MEIMAESIQKTSDFFVLSSFSDLNSLFIKNILKAKLAYTRINLKKGFLSPKQAALIEESIDNLTIYTNDNNLSIFSQELDKDNYFTSVNQNIDLAIQQLTEESALNSQNINSVLPLYQSDLEILITAGKITLAQNYFAGIKPKISKLEKTKNGQNFKKVLNLFKAFIENLYVVPLGEFLLENKFLPNDIQPTNNIKTVDNIYSEDYVKQLVKELFSLVILPVVPSFIGNYDRLKKSFLDEDYSATAQLAKVQFDLGLDFYLLNNILQDLLTVLLFSSKEQSNYNEQVDELKQLWELSLIAENLIAENINFAKNGLNSLFLILNIVIKIMFKTINIL